MKPARSLAQPFERPQVSQFRYYPAPSLMQKTEEKPVRLDLA